MTRLLWMSVCVLVGSGCDIEEPAVQLSEADAAAYERGACPMPDNCNALVALFNAEARDVRRCDSDAECGQVLTGTSCGCTRNWVAAADADVSCFYDLQQTIFDDPGCSLGLATTCDCPPTDGFACVDHECTWNYTGRPIFEL